MISSGKDISYKKKLFLVVKKNRIVKNYSCCCLKSLIRHIFCIILADDWIGVVRYPFILEKNKGGREAFILRTVVNALKIVFKA